MYKTDLPFRFCKIRLRNTLFFLAEKMFVCCFVCFVATLSDFDLLLKKTLLKVTILQSESERGVNSICITILRFFQIS